MPDAAQWRDLVIRTLRALKNAFTEGVSNLSELFSGGYSRLLPFALAIAALAGIGIAIALLVHLGTSDGRDRTVQQDQRPGLVRPVALRDFEFPEMHLYGPEGEFYRARDPHEPWTREEIDRLKLDTESKAVDIIREENRELLLELLNMQQ